MAGERSVTSLAPNGPPVTRLIEGQKFIAVDPFTDSERWAKVDIVPTSTGAPQTFTVDMDYDEWSVTFTGARDAK